MINDLSKFNIIKTKDVLVHNFLESLDEIWAHQTDKVKNSEKIKEMDLRSLFRNLRNYKQNKAQRKESVRDMKDKLVALMSKNIKIVKDILSDDDDVPTDNNSKEYGEFKRFAELSSQAALKLQENQEI